MIISTTKCLTLHKFSKRVNVNKVNKIKIFKKMIKTFFIKLMVIGKINQISSMSYLLELNTLNKFSIIAALNFSPENVQILIKGC